MIFNLILLPLMASIFLMFMPNKYFFFLRLFVILISFQMFFFSLFLLLLFDKSSNYFQFMNIMYFSYSEIMLGIDGISLFLMILTTFLTPICMLSNWNNIFYFKYFSIFFFLIEFFLILIFSLLDLLMFYIFFESILIPMFLTIGLWGSGSRKVRSGFFFFFYTLVSSILMLLVMLFIYVNIGSFNYLILSTMNYNYNMEFMLWFGFILSFMSKVPMMPFHLWLPEAHVEAPTSGSVLLAGMLLKLGTYGILSFLIPLFPLSTIYYNPLMFAIGGFSIMYASCTAIRQTDLKRIIAYTSMAHMNLVVISLFIFNNVAFTGSLFQMISHGMVSSALFFCMGFYYDRYHTSIIENFGGSMQFMPILSTFFLLFNLANLAMPLTCNFVGEFLMLCGICLKNNFMCFICSFSMVFSGIYSLWMCNRICYGNMKLIFNNDLNRFEFFMLFILVFFMFLFGIFSTLFTDFVEFTMYYMMSFVKCKVLYK